MKKTDLTKLTPSEYYWVFKDELSSMIKKAFNEDEVLMFVTYQPTRHTLDHNKVILDTRAVFNQHRYIEVLERTFKTSRLYNDGKYIDGYHSHVIMTEADYLVCKDLLKGMDIVAKVIYNIAGLVKYLCKQTVNRFTRLLPITNIPEQVTTRVSKITKWIKKKIVKIVKTVQRIRTKSFARIKLCFIKTYRIVLARGKRFFYSYLMRR